MTQTLDQLLAQCEKEALHLSGAIQPWGALLGIDAESGHITHASANVEQFIGQGPAFLLGQKAEILPWLPAGVVRHLPRQDGYTLALAGVAHAAAGPVDAQLVCSGNNVLVELEAAGEKVDAGLLNDHQRRLLAVPSGEPEVDDYHRSLLAAFRSLIGFDRLMLYRFHDDWSGEVVAESTTAALGSYLGLRFPASDIPAIARNLYLINPCRSIPDATAAPVPILSLDESPPDLTWSDLRSVSPVHLEYLSNMGVEASFSVPIRVEGRLWGLVACHHHLSRRLPRIQRSVCVALAGTYSLGLEGVLARRRLAALEQSRRHVDGVLEALGQYDDPLEGIGRSGPLLLDALAAEGFAMAVGEDFVCHGRSPAADLLARIDRWFLDQAGDGPFATDTLGPYFPAEKGLPAVASGLLAVKHRSRRSGWVRFYWFRPEAPREVAWAGNPGKPVMEDAGALRLSPRRSFDRWVQLMTGFSRPWSPEQIQTADRFRSSLLRWL